MTEIKPEIKVEEYVRLSKSSPYFESQGLHEVGIVTQLENNIVNVEFFDGYNNHYHIKELEFVDKTLYKRPPIPIPTIGTDPELEIFDEFGIINANTVLSARTDVPVGTDGNSNIAELRPKYGKTALELTDNISSLIRKLKFKCDEKFGRDTNYIIRAGNGKRMSLGGHIHFGILKPDRDELVDALDLLAIAVSTIYNKKHFKVRTSSSYGKLSDVRAQPWGVEYRTFPSYIMDRDNTEQILCASHCLAIDFVRGDLSKNIYFKRLSKWYNKYRTTIKIKYENQDNVFNFKIKAIYKMIRSTKAYNEMEGYKSRVDKLFERIKNKEEINENNDVMANWGVKDCFSKSRIKIFSFSEDEDLDKLKIKKNIISIQSIDKAKYEIFPLYIYGLKKERNTDIAINNEKVYKIIKNFIKNNKLKWVIQEAAYSQSNCGPQLGISIALRKNCQDELKKMLEYIKEEVKKCVA